MATRALFGLLLLSLPTWGTLPPWSYDPGPSRDTALGRELIDIVAAVPHMAGVSERLTDGQKFRPAYGPVPWRMRSGENEVKILFIGQDATHIAEAAGRTATAGFGGRAQNLAEYFGVNESAAFINTFAFTIKGQYGAFESPLISQGDDDPSVSFGSFVDNHLWLMTHSPLSPIARWRNNLIDWIIRNNQKSLKLIVLFGGAARDAAASFIEAKGGIVESRLSNEAAKNYKIPATRLEYAGGNNEFPVALDRFGKDLYSKLAKKKLDYSKVPNQQLAKKTLEDNLQSALEQMVFSEGGPLGNGLVHAAQLGGYNLAKINIGGKRTISIKGLTLSDGSKVKNDVLLVQLPHPTALSSMDKAEAAKKVKAALVAITPFSKKGWAIEPDPEQTNSFDAGDDYEYSRTDIGPEFYDFGAPGVRMVPVSTASRMAKKPHVIIFGSRNPAQFDQTLVDEITDAAPAEAIESSEMFTARPRGVRSRLEFNSGPGEAMARLMKSNLPLDEIFQEEEGLSWEENGIDAFSVKSHPDVGDFGHYRGTFDNPKVLILADPHGYDDLITARALTGSRGQYLHGLMRDLKIKDNYLVIKTVPFGMDGAEREDWNRVLNLTKAYREKIIAAVLKTGTSIVVTDGPHAKSEAERILKGNEEVELFSIDRSEETDSGIAEAGKELAAALGLGRGVRITSKMANIPRTHLSFYARIWEGTSGDRVINSIDQYRGQAFAEIAPRWAWEQPADLGEDESNIEDLIQEMRSMGIRLPGETVLDYIKRTERRGAVHFLPGRMPGRMMVLNFAA